MESPHHRVLMNFQFRDGWVVHFIEADCKTPVSPGRFYECISLDQVRQILTRAGAPPETHAEFEHDVRSWSRGSVYLDLTPEQYAKLK